MLLVVFVLSLFANAAVSSPGCSENLKDSSMMVRMCNDRRVMKSCETGYAMNGPKMDFCQQGHLMDEQSKCIPILSSGDSMDDEYASMESTSSGREGTQMDLSSEKTMRCSRMQRVRKSVSQMTDAEMREFAKTLKKVSTNKRFHDTWRRLKDLHHSVFHQVHKPGQFLAFVRFYTLADENLLCNANPNVVIPYWDFTCWSSNPLEAPVWSDAFLGGDGDPNNNMCVTSGPFSSNRWRLPDGQCLKRHIQCPFPPPKAVEWVMQCRDFYCFESRMKITIHDQILGSIGGTMATSNLSTFAPETEVVHAFIDKLWDDWQKKMGSAQYPKDMDVLVAGTPYTVRQLLDNNNLPEGVSVTYQESECENGPTAGVCRGCESSESTEWLYTPLFEPLRVYGLSTWSRYLLYDSTRYINGKNDDMMMIMMEMSCGNDVMMSCPNGYMMDGPKMTRRYQHDQMSTCMPIVQEGQGYEARGRGTQSEASLRSKAIFDTCPKSSLPYMFNTTCSVKRRLRKEMTSMTAAERRRYINAVVELSTNVKYEMKYRRLLDVHQKVADVDRHQWFAFNRWFVMEYENLLCEIEPEVTVPYWDPTCWSCNPMAAPIWSRDFMGGDGDPNQDYCVTDGPFAKGKWSLPCNHCLKRQIQCPFPPPAIVNQAMSCDDFACVNMYLHSTFHLQLHGHNGGTMTSQAAAYAPEYMLYHAYLDKLHDDWQRSRARSESDIDMNAYVMKSQHKVRDMIDSRNLPGKISVTYQPHVCSGMPEICRCTSCYSNKEMPYTPMFEPLLWFNVSESEMLALQESFMMMNE